mmetsp:Transcript_35799/g.91425  ORF Transcript_35799/g.91425 Transcript_35799/m.91425 type:complete len:198 (+) Transcript_35799:495-1088(+)
MPRGSAGGAAEGRVPSRILQMQRGTGGSDVCGHRDRAGPRHLLRAFGSLICRSDSAHTAAIHAPAACDDCQAIRLTYLISSKYYGACIPLAGFPLTQKDIGRHFVVTSAHSPDKLNWEHLSAIDTIVILMGGAKIPDIVTRLKAAGRDPSTPVCIIRWAGTDKQQVWRGCIDNIVDITQGESLSPCIIVVGQVAGSV